jgi:putative FmdB family regulatory protein
MPTYEYSCDHCGNHFERFQSMSEDRLKRCPKCRHKITRLLGTGAGIIFKGTGFYETDYRRKSQPEPASASSGETKPEGSGTEKASAKGNEAGKKTAEAVKD